MFDSISLGRSLIDGTLLSAVLGVIVLGSLMINARLWLQDYPKPIQEKVPPLSPAEKRGRVVVAVLLIGTLLGGLLLEALGMRGQAVSFGAAYLHIFVMLLIFNLVDALVIDLFIITLLKPKFVILPGAEGMEYLFADYRKQFVDFLKGLAFCVVASLPFALIVVI